MTHMLHKKFEVSTDLWVCIHGVAYPDLCEDCRKETNANDRKPAADSQPAAK